MTYKYLLRIGSESKAKHMKSIYNQNQSFEFDSQYKSEKHQFKCMVGSQLCSIDSPPPCANCLAF